MRNEPGSGACRRTAPPGARRKALVTDDASAPGGAAPSGATRVWVHFAVHSKVMILFTNRSWNDPAAHFRGGTRLHCRAAAAEGKRRLRSCVLVDASFDPHQRAASHALDGRCPSRGIHDQLEIRRAHLSPRRSPAQSDQRDCDSRLENESHHGTPPALIPNS